MFSESEKYEVTSPISMAAKLKSMFKRHVSQPVGKNTENTEESSAIIQEMQQIPHDFVRKRDEKSLTIDLRSSNGTKEEPALRRRINRTRRHNTSLGAIEDLLQCPICNDRLKSPRMMPCQHTFCQKCLEKQLEKTKTSEGEVDLTCPLCKLRVTDRLPDMLPTNLYIESLLNVMENPGEGWLRLAARNPVVSFAPLPNAKSENNETSKEPPILATLCDKCSSRCNKENRCKHCRQIFCSNCWNTHVDELKGQLERMVPQMETTSDRFTRKIENFRSKIDEIKDSIEKDIDARVAELMKEREHRIERLSYQCNRGEKTANEIQQRIDKVVENVKKQMKELSEDLGNNDDKVNIFMSLHREATELMKLENTWNPDLGEADTVDKSKNVHIELISLKRDAELFYRQKKYSAKFVVDRELVQRPSGMAYDSCRDHVFVACSGARHVVVLDKKYKLFKRYQSKEMMAPQGVAYVDHTEELFVTDKWKHCIFVFNRKGEIVRQMCTKGPAESQLSCPEGLAFHAKNNFLYVADTGNDRVQILELNGTFRGLIGASERRANSVTKSGRVHDIVVNHLNQPTDVAVTENCVIVADCGNHKVKIFNHNGNLVHTLGGSGTLRRHFRSPEVVAVDNRGNIIVGDSGNARVQIFSPQGNLLRVLGGRSSKSNNFGWVSGVLVKNNFDLLIGDNKNSAITIFNS
ncbi:tripartite motif-containing protein 2-like [Venturia canescens]|uniref:tripartite motif-containing protein 2-like n=1 Tax=Venturia canescens TaxID=32260 RepID=UPI001C9BE943|nr:tripartite motif-containing protein 2-like [Venturia canescens]